MFYLMIKGLALIVIIVIDQLRMDVLVRELPSLQNDGLAQIYQQGLSFEEAHHVNFFNMTCPGHVALSTGALGTLSGIFLNFEFDRKTQKRSYCLEDANYKWIDAAEDATQADEVGTSPMKIRVTSVSDELKILNGDSSKVLSVSMKDRSAIALAGRLGDSAYWYAEYSKKYTTSNYYNKKGALPQWVTKFNTQLRPKIKKGEFYEESLNSIKDMTDFALLGVEEENIGRHPKTDLLWLSYSTFDIASHGAGDKSQYQSQALREVDSQIARLLKELKSKIGKKKIMVVLTADHGSGNDVTKWSQENIPSGRRSRQEFQNQLNTCLKKNGIKTSDGKDPVVNVYAMNIYLSSKLKNREQTLSMVKRCTSDETGLWNTFTKEEIFSNQMPQVPWLENLSSSIPPEKAPDLVGVQRPYWISAILKQRTSHETPYDYDSWVPLSLWWSDVKPKKVFRKVSVTSLAPTLSDILQVSRPSGAMAGPLPEVLEEIQNQK